MRFVPVATTISRLRSLREPAVLRPVEFTVYRVRARLVEYKRERDRDFQY